MSSETIPSVICVLDSSAIIHIKQAVPLADQWDLLSQMREMVVGGELAFPRQVFKEMSAAQHPDAPGVWVGNAYKLVCHPQPSEDTLVRVLEVASQLVEVDLPPEREVADPYVAAMALELVERHPGSRIVVVTDDIVDREPLKISLRTACERLSLEQCGLGAFLAWLADPASADLVDPAETAD